MLLASDSETILVEMFLTEFPIHITAFTVPYRHARDAKRLDSLTLPFGSLNINNPVVKHCGAVIFYGGRAKKGVRMPEFTRDFATPPRQCAM